MRASSRLPHTPAASCGSPATSAARRRRAHVPGECSPPCGTASQGRYRRTDLGSARPQRLRQSGSPKPHRTRIAPPAATFRNVPKADPPAARADNLRISIRRPPAPADCGEEVRRQELPEGAGKGCTGTRTAAMRPEKPMLRKDTTTHPETHRTETGAPARAAGRDRKRMCRNSHRGNAAGKADAAQRHDNPPRNPPNRDKGAPARAAGRGRERMCRDPHRGNAAGKADAAQRHDNPPRNPPNRDKGASARAAGRGRKRMHRNPHRGNAAGKADAAQRHDNPPRNPPNRDKGASARAAGRGRKRMHRNPHRGNAAGKADAAQRHDNPPRNPPNRDRCAAEAVASSGGDPPRRPPPEADAHRPARRPEENPAAG